MSLQIQVVKPGPKRKKGRRGKKKSSQPRVVVRSSAKSRRRRNRKRSRGKTAKDYSLGYGLSKAHPYIKSLLDPEQHTGRVPDVNNYATTAFQVVEAVELISSADGACGIIFSPTPVDPSTTNYHHGQAGNALETTATVGIWGNSSFITATSSSAVTNNFEAFRCVSGCVCAEYVGDTNTDAGTITCCPIFRSEQAPVKRKDAELLSYNQTFPLRNGIRCLWRPVDNGDLEFCGGGDPAGTDNLPSVSYGILGTAATVPRNISPIGERCPAAICLMVSGATASKLILRIRYVFNYEAIPTRMSTGFFSVSTTPADRSVIDQASNIVKALPWSEAWQGVAGVAGRLGQEMAQSAFSAAGSYVGAGVLSALHAGRNRRYAEIDLD